MTDRERAEVVELFRRAAADNGSVVGQLVATVDLTDEQCDVISKAHHATYFAVPFDKRNRVQACFEAARRVGEGEWS